jgi:hypothetical protein
MPFSAPQSPVMSNRFSDHDDLRVPPHHYDFVPGMQPSEFPDDPFLPMADASPPPALSAASGQDETSTTSNHDPGAYPIKSYKYCNYKYLCILHFC